MSDASGQMPDVDAAVDAFLDDAGRLVQDGRLTEAFAVLQQAERLAPDDPAVLFGIGGIHLQSRRYAEAVAYLERANTLDPDLALAQYHFGMALQLVGRDEAAIAALRHAVTLDPTLADAYARLGDLLDYRQRQAEAIDCFRRGAAAAPETTWGQLNSVKALLAERRLDEAETCLRRIVANDPQSWNAHWMLGRLFSQVGRFDAAIACFRQTIHLEPRCVGAYSSLVSAGPVSGADGSLIARMAVLLDDTTLTDPERMALHFSLGKAFDDMQDRASAMRHFDAANRMRRGSRGADYAGVADWVDRVIARCTPEFFDRHAGVGVDDETPVLIVGMPRSGTTLVEQIVSSHPRVAAGGELPFWASRGPDWANAGMPAIDQAAAAEIAADYRALLRDLAPDALRITDKRPYNFEWIGLIRTIFPRARIIHCRRNPVDTCLSIYCTPLAAGRGFESDRANLVFYYRQYQRLMAHWRAVLPADRFLEIDYESLTGDHDASIRRLIAFCGLEWDDACLRYRTNPNAVQTVSMWQVRQPIYRTSVERWRRYEPWLGELRELLDEVRQ